MKNYAFAIYLLLALLYFGTFIARAYADTVYNMNFGSTAKPAATSSATPSDTNTNPEKTQETTPSGTPAANTPAGTVSSTPSDGSTPRLEEFFPSEYVFFRVFKSHYLLGVGICYEGLVRGSTDGSMKSSSVSLNIRVRPLRFFGVEGTISLKNTDDDNRYYRTSGNLYLYSGKFVDFGLTGGAVYGFKKRSTRSVVPHAGMIFDIHPHPNVTFNLHASWIYSKSSIFGGGLSINI